MDIQVREVTSEEKSVQEVESELLAKHEQEQVEKMKEPEPQPEPQPQPEPDESVVLSYIKNRYNKDINSVDEIFAQRESNEDLPGDVSAFLKFKKETGRGMDDFMKLNRDFEKEDPIKVLSEYLATQNPDFDKDDIMFEIESKYQFDEELDDEREIKSKKIAMKKDLSEALKYFNSQKEQYKIPLESRGQGVQPEDAEGYEAYKRSIKERGQLEEMATKQSEYFVNKTNELFSKDFKGFGFDIDGKSFVYKPGDTEKVKEFQMNVNNFVATHLDEKGFLKDAAKYHKSLAVATNPDAFAKYFYEQGRADEVANSARAIKNIDMGGVRNAPQAIDKGGFKVTAVDEQFGSGLRIKSNKNR